MYRTSNLKSCSSESFVCLVPKSVTIKVYENTVLPRVLYGRKSWSLTLREERTRTDWDAEENIWT
jgi:hypothetical protein